MERWFTDCKKVIKDSRQFWPAFVVISWSCRGVGVPAPTDRNKPCPRKAMQERGLESDAGKPCRKATHKLCNDRQARPFNIFRKRSHTCHRNIASHRSRLFKETLVFFISRLSLWRAWIARCTSTLLPEIPHFSAADLVETGYPITYVWSLIRKMSKHPLQRGAFLGQCSSML